jgi:hypothetical protein
MTARSAIALALTALAVLAGCGRAATTALASEDGAPAATSSAAPAPADPSVAEARNAAWRTAHDWVPQTWLPGHVFVVYYGNPLSPFMGVLGQYPPETMLAKLRAQAEAYARLTDLPVQPALDVVAVVAQGGPQPDGTYRLRMPDELIRSWAALAEREHMPLFLDVQVGRSSVAAEVAALQPYLELPWVELGLDPEFDMPPGLRPGQRIGTMHAAEVNWASAYLSRLVREQHLPQKVLIVHQFTAGMLPDWQQVQPAPGVALVLDMDGFGAQDTKAAYYGLFVQQEPIPGRFGGIKLFYSQDTPIFRPEQVMRFQPTPSLIMYQ